MYKRQKLERAGDLFEATSGISNSDDMKGYLLEKAVESYQNAYNLDSTNSNLLMKYAGSLIEQGASPMQGIAMLLDIVKKDPDNADAQLMLGKFAMMSGQFEKAVQRLEKVISLRPQSNDALFLLAMAYENKGDKGKALEILPVSYTHLDVYKRQNLILANRATQYPWGLAPNRERLGSAF